MSKNSEIFKNQREDFDKAINDAITIMGVEAVNFFNQSFKEQGFLNEDFEQWAPRKKKDPQRGQRNILIKTGDLQRSIKVVNKSSDSVTIGTDVEYAKYHNEGIPGRLPKREFMGDSKKLFEIIADKIRKKIKGVFK